MIKPNKLWPIVGHGRHRDVYRLPSGNVIKFPRGTAGEVANIWEAIVWRFRYHRDNLPEFIRRCMDDEAQYARCRLVPRTNILVMEFVRFEHINGLPHWAQGMDGGQAGINSAGNIVAYDYADFCDDDLELAQVAIESARYL